MQQEVHAEPLENPRLTGRPSIFTQEVADHICELMSEGKGLREICEMQGMPGRRTVLAWAEKNNEFQHQYARARDAMMDWYAEEIIRIANDESGDVLIDQVDGGTRAVANHAKVQRDKLRIDTFKFLMSKLAPRRYGTTPDDRVPGHSSINKIELVGVQTAERIVFGWEDRQKVVMPDDEPAEPRQITYQPQFDLPPEAWRVMLDVINLIEAHSPPDSAETPEAVLSVVKKALIDHYSARRRGDGSKLSRPNSASKFSNIESMSSAVALTPW